MALPPASLTLSYLPQVEPEALSEQLVAFANSDGGTILLGLDESGLGPRKLDLTQTAEDMLRQAAGLCRPVVPAEWEETQLEGRTVVAVRVPRSSELHSLADGRVLVRHGPSIRPLGGEEIRLLAATRSTGDFESERAEGVSWDELDADLVEEFLGKRQARLRLATRGEARQVLEEMGCVRPDGQVSVGGLLLFGRFPEKYLPQEGLLFVRFPGTETEGAGVQAGYGRREEIAGPLARVIENAWRLLREEMSTNAVLRDLEREEQSEYPLFAVREALVNAVCHRDYRIRGRRIEVRLYRDRLEVTSPGGLPGYITLDNLVEEHYSRNPRLVAGLYHWGYVEELGLGIDRMIEEMVADGRPPPFFHATPYSFRVTLAAKRERPPIPSWERNLNERQAHALNYVHEHGRITNREYRLLCPSLVAETLRLDLAGLVRQGLLLKVGDKKGTYYILR
ncbi:MAG: ATP-binding protein [Anaerolineales bacterium]